MRKELEQDNQELQQKYQQKAMCASSRASFVLKLCGCSAGAALRGENVLRKSSDTF